MKQDLYQKVTDKIITDLKQGELTWLKPWSAGHMDGRIVKPLRHNGQAYNGINVLMLWDAAMEGGFASPYARSAACCHVQRPAARVPRA